MEKVHKGNAESMSMSYIGRSRGKPDFQDSGKETPIQENSGDFPENSHKIQSTCHFGELQELMFEDCPRASE